MATIIFDILKFVERLKLAGVSEEQAKAEVEALTLALNETIAVRELATKSDLEAIKSDLIKWMAGLLLALRWLSCCSWVGCWVVPRRLKRRRLDSNRKRG